MAAQYEIGGAWFHLDGRCRLLNRRGAWLDLEGPNLGLVPWELNSIAEAGWSHQAETTLRAFKLGLLRVRLTHNRHVLDIAGSESRVNAKEAFQGLILLFDLLGIESGTARYALWEADIEAIRAGIIVPINRFCRFTSHVQAGIVALEPLSETGRISFADRL